MVDGKLSRTGIGVSGCAGTVVRGIGGGNGVVGRGITLIGETTGDLVADSGGCGKGSNRACCVPKIDVDSFVVGMLFLGCIFHIISNPH